MRNTVKLILRSFVIVVMLAGQGISLDGGDTGGSEFFNRVPNLDRWARIAVQWILTAPEGIERRIATRALNGESYTPSRVIASTLRNQGFLGLGRGGVANIPASLTWYVRLPLYKDGPGYIEDNLKLEEGGICNMALHSTLLGAYETIARLPFDRVRTLKMTDPGFKYNQVPSMRLNSLYPRPLFYGASATYSWMVFISSAKLYKSAVQHFLGQEELSLWTTLSVGICVGATTSYASAPWLVAQHNFLSNQYIGPKAIFRRLASREGLKVMHNVAMANLFTRIMAGAATILLSK